MFTHILFDADVIVIKSPPLQFSQKISREFNIPYETILPFFKNEFQLCLVGQADLKQAITKYLDNWNWSKSVDELLQYWFQEESQIDNRIIDHVTKLRPQDIQCYVHTNNEKYRTQYIWQNLELNHNFDGIFSSTEIGHKKPYAEFWQAIYQQLKEPVKTNLLLWDDDPDNVTAAAQFGFTAKLYSDFPDYLHQMKQLI